MYIGDDIKVSIEFKIKADTNKRHCYLIINDEDDKLVLTGEEAERYADQLNGILIKLHKLY